MAEKKKPSSGRHTTPRNNIGMAGDWYELARELASEGKQPVLWYLMSCLAEKADAKGKKRPTLPWEKKPDKPGKP